MRARVRERPVAESRGSARAGVGYGRVADIQRSRMLAAALEAIDELGYSRVTVAHVTSRARVSRRTFYELFGNREDCLLAALESVVELVGDELARADLDGLSWRERVRTGLWVILAFLEREPVLARVVVVQALRGGPRVLESRERVLARLADVVDGGRLESGARGVECQPLMAEGLVGAAFAIVYGRLLRGEREPLTGLFGELMEMIVRPYVGPAAARREQARPVPVVAPSAAVVSGVGSVVSDGEPVGGRGGGSGDPLVGVPMRLTFRTALVLEVIAGRPGVSNRVVGDLAGVSDQGQISKLLARLERLGLAQNTGGGHVRGESNAWSLTGLGCEVALRLRANVVVRGEGA